MEEMEMETKSTKKKITITLKAETKSKLQAIAKREGKSVSNLAQEFLKAQLEHGE